MSDWFFKHKRRDGLVNWLGLDSWIDSSVANARENLIDRYNAASSFFARFRLSGWRRLVSELASEALTLGCGGLALMYVLAIPAFLEMDESKVMGTGKFAVKFLDVNGKEIGQRGILHNDSISLEDIPDHLIKATLATEDRRFFEHFGIDLIGTARALATNLNAGETVQGGSTLTQQLAKNIFLSSERSLTRKLKELFLSFWLEAKYTKREILKLYFDRAYMGGGTFGVEAAAQFYFGKSVRDVTLAEAAMMAGLFKAPTKYAPHIDLPAARARANDVLSNLVESGYMTPGQVHAARLNPAKPIETRLAYSPDWYLDWAYEEIQRLMEGKGQFVLTARTTVDLDLQRKADEVLTSSVRKMGREARFNSGAIVSMEPDGAVRAIAGGPDYGESQFNRATHARRQPGSSFKVYVYAAALAKGYKPDTSVRDYSRSCGNWHPQNYGGGHGGGGSMPLWTALAKSLNTVATELSFVVGRETVIDLTKAAGIRGVRKTCSMALGDYGITPLEHTGGVAMFANGGKRALPYAILEVSNSKGELLYSRERDEPEPPQILPRRVAEQMNQMLAKVVTDGTARDAIIDYTYTAGKTGTSTGPKDVWFVGFSGKYVTSVWLGNDDNRAMAGNTTGGHAAAPVWKQFMAAAHTSMDIPQIPGLPQHPIQVAERQRQEELRRSQPALAQQDAGPGQKRSNSLMTDHTRNALRKVGQALRVAAGVSATDSEPIVEQAPLAPPLPAAAPAIVPQAPAATPPEPSDTAPTRPATKGRQRRAEAPTAPDEPAPPTRRPSSQSTNR